MGLEHHCYGTQWVREGHIRTLPGGFCSRIRVRACNSSVAWRNGSSHSWMWFPVPHGKCHLVSHQSPCSCHFSGRCLEPCSTSAGKRMGHQKRHGLGPSEGPTLSPSDAFWPVGTSLEKKEECWNSLLGNLKTHQSIFRTLFNDSPWFFLVNLQKYSL